jgi:hypothetical protein
MARSLSCRFPPRQPENKTPFKKESSGAVRRHRISPAKLAPRAFEHTRSRVQQLPCPVRRPMRLSASRRGAAMAFLSAHPEAAVMAEWHGKSRYYRRKRSPSDPDRHAAATRLCDARRPAGRARSSEPSAACRIIKADVPRAPKKELNPAVRDRGVLTSPSSVAGPRPASAKATAFRSRWVTDC